MLQKARLLSLVLLLTCLPATVLAAGTMVAVFPLQDLNGGRNDVNLFVSEVLARHLAESGNEILPPGKVVPFLAAHRIRTVGNLSSLDISLARSGLGVPFLLLGTITQRKDKPEPSMGLLLRLIRTNDARTVWTYAGSLSRSDERRLLGLGEPQSTDELLRYLLDEIVEQWPWKMIADEQDVESLHIDSVVLQPAQLRPGSEVHARVRLRNTWPENQKPRVFFKVEDQLYPATASVDKITYEGSWVAGEKAGSFPVTLLVKWPLYDRVETTLLGYVLVDNTAPLFELLMRNIQMIGGLPVFSSQVKFLPRMIVRKPLSHWHVSIYHESGDLVGEMDGEGNLPESLTWKGRGNVGDGIYNLVMDVWDEPGNSARASKWFRMDTKTTKLGLELTREDEEVIVALKQDGRVPLKYWRLEMWTKEGKLITQTEGAELPAKFNVKLPDLEGELDVEGFLFYQDTFGHKGQEKVQNLLPKLEKTSQPGKKKRKGVSESWVNEF